MINLLIFSEVVLLMHFFFTHKASMFQLQMFTNDKSTGFPTFFYLFSISSYTWMKPWQFSIPYM
jgi:hypothetical protein